MKKFYFVFAYNKDYGYIKLTNREIYHGSEVWRYSDYRNYSVCDTSEMMRANAWIRDEKDDEIPKDLNIDTEA